MGKISYSAWKTKEELEYGELASCSKQQKFKSLAT